MVDCLAGTAPSPLPVMITAEQDLSYFNSRAVTFDRLHPKLPNTAIPIIGNSQVESMNVTAISSRCVGFGINGDTMRGAFHRINRVPASNIVHRCDCAIMADPQLNDLVYENANWDVNPPYLLGLMAGWITGKWVWIKPYPVNSLQFTGTSNVRLKAYGAHVDAQFAGNPNVAVVDAWSALTGGGSDLLAAYSDGSGDHLSAAGEAVVIPLIQAAMVSLGVTA